MHDTSCRVWTFRNDGPVAAAELALLNGEERVHGARLMRDADRTAFIKTRAALRNIIGQATGRSPGGLAFNHNEWGKPSIDPSISTELDFSVTHANGLSAIALAQGVAVGIDVEPMRPCPDRVRIAADVFGTEVAQRLLAVDRQQQDRLFLELWTAGEAFVKASGLGFAGTQGKLPVRVSAAVPARVMLRDGLRDHWTLSPLELGDGFVGHLVVGRHVGNAARDHSFELRVAARTASG